MTRVRVIAILSWVMVLGACTSSETTQPVRAAELDVSVTGSVIAPTGKPTMMCHTVLDSFPPQCGGGIEIIGLDVSTLPQARDENGVVWTEGPVRLVGLFDTSVSTLTLSEPPASASVDDPFSSRRDLPCEEPSDGWPTDPIRNNDGVMLRRYGEQNPDTWSGLRIDSQRPVWVMAFTGDLPRHTAELAKIYDGPICVIEADHTSVELDTALTEIRGMSVEPTDQGPSVLLSVVDEFNYRILVVLWLADEVALAPLSEFDKDMVSVSGWIELLDGDG